MRDNEGDEDDVRGFAQDAAVQRGEISNMRPRTVRVGDLWALEFS